MSTSIILAYILIVIGIVGWAVLIPSGKHVGPKFTSYITIFGGAFLFASCFINLVPHIFLGEDPYRFVTPNWHFKIAASVMVGFLIQLLLEQLTRGAEHGHNHCPCCEEEVVFDEDVLADGEVVCPNCGERLEFDLSDLANATNKDEE